MHRIMCICNAHDLHQHVININSDDNHQKPLSSKFLIGSVKASKTSNGKEEKNHYPFNFYLKWHTCYELLKIRRDVKIHINDPRKNFPQGSALKPECRALGTDTVMFPYQGLQPCVGQTWGPSLSPSWPGQRLRHAESGGDGRRGSEPRGSGQNRKRTKTTIY